MAGKKRKDWHGMWGTPEYRVWIKMRDRCNNVNSDWYHRYGGRGIKVCDRWGRFENFLKDIGKKPNKKYTLDRIDNNGNYEPSNCRWSTHTDNMKNTNRSKYWHIGGSTFESARDASEYYGVAQATVRGWCMGRKTKKRSYPPRDGCWCELKYKEAT